MNCENNIKNIQSTIIEAFNYRHATKLFDAERKINDEQFNTILEAIRLSPSSFGFEPWQVLVVQTPEKRELLREFSWGANGEFHGTDGQLGTASHFLVFLSHTETTMKHSSDYLEEHMKNVKELPQEVVDFINQAYKTFQEEDFKIKDNRQIVDWAGKQAYIALGNAMTVAALMGIDSCPIEGFDQEKAAAVLEKHFGVDRKRYKPSVMLALGYRLADPDRPKTRRDLDQIVTWF